jgi:hypothetical protein
MEAVSWIPATDAGLGPGIGEDKHVSAAVSGNGGAAGAAASARTDAGHCEVTRNLASFRAPEMPSRLAARLDRALAAESARRAGRTGHMR